MTQPLRIAVLSDTHFTTDPQAESFCWNEVRCSKSLPSLPVLVQTLQTLDLDLIVHLGDFTNDGSLEAYEAGMAGLSQVGVPVYVVRGNHDTGPVQTRLSDDEGRIDRTFVAGGVRFILLDSCVRESEIDPQGDRRRRIIQPDQLAWLEQVLLDDRDSLTVIATHFPLHTSAFYPTTVDPDRNSVNGLSADAIKQRIGFIGNMGDVWSLIRRFPNVRLCLSGHWHINEIDCVDHIWQIISPSTCEFPCQFRLLTFEPDHLIVENMASGIDPLSSFVAANHNDFPLGNPEDRTRVIRWHDER